ISVASTGRRWLRHWRRMTRASPRYRMIFWTTFAVTFGLTSPPALLTAQRESEPLTGSFVAAALSIFFAFWMAALVPYLFTRSELRRLIESQLTHDRAA